MIFVASCTTADGREFSFQLEAEDAQEAEMIVATARANLKLDGVLEATGKASAAFTVKK